MGCGLSKPAQESPAVATVGDAACTKDPYVGAPNPANEDERLACLCNFNILDTAPETRFDSITKLCSTIFKVPIALVSLVQDERQWFKSVVGLDASQTDRNSSFCAWTLLPEYPTALVVENAEQDARFARNPLVLGDPHIRFYAGCPLVTSTGQRLGSLCIIDRQPRKFDAESCNVLANLAEMVVREIERDNVDRSRESEQMKLLRNLNSVKDGVILLHASHPGWPVVFMNEACRDIVFGAAPPPAAPKFWDIFTAVTDTSGNSTSMLFNDAVAKQQNFDIHVRAANNNELLQIQLRCAANTPISSFMPVIAVPAFLESNLNGPTYYFATVNTVHRHSSNSARKSTESTDSGNGTRMSSSSYAPMHIIPRNDPLLDVQIGPLVGKGAYGRVYRGHWNGSQVAVKVLEHIEQAEALGNQDPIFEALLCTQLSHPNVVQTFKYITREAVIEFEDGDESMLETWLVCEFCNKGQLSDAIVRGRFRKQQSLFETEMRTLLLTALEVARALAYLHSRSILHGDLSSNNILLTSSTGDSRGFTAKVSDFGLSRVLAPGSAHIQTQTYGTITHMPPELLTYGTMSKAVDVWAFGMVLWEMYMGARPYSGMSHAQILYHVTSGQKAELSKTAPPALRDLFHRCMASAPEQRPSFEDIQQELKQQLAQLPEQQPAA